VTDRGKGPRAGRVLHARPGRCTKPGRYSADERSASDPGSAALWRPPRGRLARRFPLGYQQHPAQSRMITPAFARHRGQILAGHGPRVRAGDHGLELIAVGSDRASRSASCPHDPSDTPVSSNPVTTSGALPGLLACTLAQQRSQSRPRRWHRGARAGPAFHYNLIALFGARLLDADLLRQLNEALEELGGVQRRPRESGNGPARFGRSSGLLRHLNRCIRSRRW
jgi:hypothetical protein